MTNDSDARSPRSSRAAWTETMIDVAALPHHPDAVGEGPNQLHRFLPVPAPVDHPSICIAMVTSGQLEWECSQSLLRVLSEPNVSFIGRPNGPYMDMGRNEVTIEFYRNPSLGDWLLWLDSDVADFTYEDLLLLTQSGHHIVGGAYSSPHDGREFIVAYNWGPGQHGPMTLLDLVLDDLDAMPPEPVPIAAIGTGFLAIHRSVIEAFPHYYDPPQPWFAELTLMPPADSDDATDADPDAPSDVTTGIHLGEDMTFCLRANALGVPVHIHPLVRLTHYKKMGITLPPHPSRLPSVP